MLNKKKLRYPALIIVSSLIIYFVLSVQAGNLNPTSSVAPTMKSIEEIYSILVGSHNSATITGKRDGNASEMLKCITDELASSGSCS